MTNAIRNITPKELSLRLKEGPAVTLIDVREADEKKIADIGGDLIPVGTVIEQAARIPRSGDVVIYCRSGGRSTAAIKELQTRCGFTNLINLTGGILGWADHVDPSIQKY